MEAVATSPVSQKPRRHPVRRATQQNAVRVGSGAGAGNATIGLGRFRPLKVENKLGLSVYSRLSILKAGGKTISEIYHELYACYSRYHELYHGSKPAFTFLETSNSVETAIQQMLMLMGDMLGDHIQYEVIKHPQTNKYYFNAYQEVHQDNYYYDINVGPVLKRLKRYYPDVYHVFTLYLAAMRGVGVDFWFCGQYGYHTSEYLKDEIQVGGHDADTIAFYRKQLRYYKNGLPGIIAKKILTQHQYRDESNQWIPFDLNLLESDLEHIADIKPCKPLYDIIVKGIPLLREQKNVIEYNGSPDDESYAYENGLRYADKFLFAWSNKDYVWEAVSEYLNMHAGEGIASPIQMLRITPDCDRLFIPDDWPTRFKDYLTEVIDLVDEFLNQNTPKNEQ